MLPLGRYLRQKLRTYVGREKTAPFAALAENDKEVCELFKTALANKTAISIKEAVVNENLGRVIRIEARARFFAKGKKL